jgi:excisionase family DNA binding protein
MEKYILLAIDIDDFRAILRDELRDVLAEAITSTPKRDQFITRTEACNLLKISPPTLKSWCRKGFLESARIGKSIRFSLNSIEEILENNNSYKYKRTI